MLSLGLAYKPLPFAWENRVVDRIFNAVADPATRQEALTQLERIAEGHPEDVGVALNAAAGRGLDASELADFSSPIVRTHALYKIAETGLPETVEYLGRVRPTGSAEFDSALGVTYRQAQYLQIVDSSRRIEFLEAAMGNASRAANVATAIWAWDTLCDGGQLASLPKIQEAIRSNYSGQPGEELIQFCRARMQIVSSDSDRVKALQAELDRLVRSRAETAMERRLAMWAVSQLLLDRGGEASLALRHFTSMVEALQGTSLGVVHLKSTAGDIQRACRTRRPDNEKSTPASTQLESSRRAPVPEPRNR